MASLSDIRQAIANYIDTLLFPNGTMVPVVSRPGSGIFKIFPDWPDSGEVTTNKLAWPPDGAGNAVIGCIDLTPPRDVTRYEQRAYLITKAVPTLTWTVIGDTVTIGGTVVSPQNVALIIDNIDVVYSVQPNDTLESIVAALLALIPPVYGAYSGSRSTPFSSDFSNDFGSGVNTPRRRRIARVGGSFDVNFSNDFDNSGGAALTITVPGAHRLIGRAGGFSKYITPTSQWRVQIAIAIFTGDDASRNALVNLIKSGLEITKRLVMDDGSMATFGVGREVTVRDMEGMGVESTRLVFDVEYSSVATTLVPQAIVFRALTYGNSILLNSTEA